MSEYPEHDKLTAVRDESQAIGEFLDNAGFTLCRVVSEGNNGEPRYIDRDGNPTDKAHHEENTWSLHEWNPAFESWRDHYAPVSGSIERILADYFEIDLDELEREKRAMLEAIRTSA